MSHTGFAEPEWQMNSVAETYQAIQHYFVYYQLGQLFAICKL